MTEGTISGFPQALDAERAVLGGLLIDPEQVPSIAEVLTREDFYSGNHGRLFQVLVDRSNGTETIDQLVMAEFVAASNNPDEYGGPAYVLGLADRVPSTLNLGAYATVIKERSIRRKLLMVASEITQNAQGGIEDLAQLLDFAEKNVFEVSQQGSTRDWHQLSQVIDQEWLKLEKLSQNRGEVTGVPTGFTELDRILAGLQPTDLIILAARPGMGKTALALNIAQNAALRGGAGVGIFSLEMGKGQLATRMLSSEARVDAHKMRTGYLSMSEDWPRLEEASERLYHAPVWIMDTPALTITQVRSKARRLKSEHPELRLLMIDYLQLMQGDGGRTQSREQQISAISRGLKGLAKELDLPILALSQLNRGVEGRPNKRPILSDLRESGAIEQDADAILFIYRDEYYNRETVDKGVAELIIAKHRHGALGTVRLAFQASNVRFENLFEGNHP
jgi:replicative DNA helicase